MEKDFFLKIAEYARKVENSELKKQEITKWKQLLDSHIRDSSILDANYFIDAKSLRVRFLESGWTKEDIEIIYGKKTIELLQNLLNLLKYKDLDETSNNLLEQSEQISDEIIQLIKLAEKNDEKAQLDLGIKYSKGDGIKKDYVEAVKWFKQSAKNDNETAKLFLAECYENGLGINKDCIEAAKLNWEVANQGGGYAMLNLKRYYENGIGVNKSMAIINMLGRIENQEVIECLIETANKKDNEKALRHLRIYYNGGEALAESQCSLGHCYYYGEGVLQNINKAHYWLKKAVDNGSAEAKRLLTTLAQNYPEVLNDKEVYDVLDNEEIDDDYKISINTKTIEVDKKGKCSTDIIRNIVDKNAGKIDLRKLVIIFKSHTIIYNLLGIFDFKIADTEEEIDFCFTEYEWHWFDLVVIDKNGDGLFWEGEYSFAERLGLPLDEYLSSDIEHLRNVYGDADKNSSFRLRKGKRCHEKDLG